jgi:hypothetical protein
MNPGARYHIFRVHSAAVVDLLLGTVLGVSACHTHFALQNLHDLNHIDLFMGGLYTYYVYAQSYKNNPLHLLTSVTQGSRHFIALNK